ncbi:unnamed protein product, partial [Allacma fusca]
NGLDHASQAVDWKTRHDTLIYENVELRNKIRRMESAGKALPHDNLSNADNYESDALTSMPEEACSAIVEHVQDIVRDHTFAEVPETFDSIYSHPAEPEARSNEVEDDADEYEARASYDNFVAAKKAKRLEFRASKEGKKFRRMKNRAKKARQSLPN